NENDDSFFNFGSFGTAEGSSMRTNIEQECERFLRCADASLSMLHQLSYVKKTFIKYNTPLPSSSPVERIFNFGQMMLDPKRQRMTYKHFERSLLLKVNTDYNVN